MDDLDRVVSELTATPAGHHRLHVFAAVGHIDERLAAWGRGREDQAWLAGYRVEMSAAWGPQVGTREIEAALAPWEATGASILPLRALGIEVGLSFAHRLALVAIGLIEDDARIGSLFASLQGGERRPTVAGVGRLFAPDGHDPWTFVRALLDEGLVEPIDTAPPRAEWALRVPAVVWEVLRGDWAHVRRQGYALTLPAEIVPVAQLIAEDGFAERLARATALLAVGEARALVLRATAGSDPTRLAGAVARGLGRGLIQLEGRARPEDPRWRYLGILAELTRSLPCVDLDLGPGETVEPPPLRGYRGPRFFALPLVGALSGREVEGALTLTVPPASHALRARAWAAYLGGAEETPAALADRFHLPVGYIRKIADMARLMARVEGHPRVTLDDVTAAARALNRQTLEGLADRIEVRGDWTGLVVSEGTRSRLDELEQRCRHREALIAHLGPGFGGGTNRGVRALFVGGSGTGKTLAARLLAAVLEKDLYRVDLAAVINKYIGETEKNLHRILSAAEELDVVLLLDEGDALLGQRTEVRSSNDRYANLETNFLLQKLEHYDGIIVITTNIGDAIDRAFRRRMDLIVNFTAPRALEREQLWRLHLPEGHGVTPGVLEALSARFGLSGAQIRNVAQHASLMALDEGRAVGARDVEEALRLEHEKAGATWPLRAESPALPAVEQFFDALLAR